MRKLCFSLCILSLYLFLGSSYAFAQKKVSVKKMTLEYLVDQINQSLEEVNKELKNTAKLEEAKISVITEKGNAQEGGISFFVKLKGSRQKTVTSTITYAYKPKLPPSGPLAMASSEILTKTILSAAKSAAEAGNITNMTLDTFTVELGFSVKRSGEGGFEFEVGSVEFGGGGEKSKSFKNNITLKFKFLN